MAINTKIFSKTRLYNVEINKNKSKNTTSSDVEGWVSVVQTNIYLSIYIYYARAVCVCVISLLHSLAILDHVYIASSRMTSF